jgi:hypothetical protein
MATIRFGTMTKRVILAAVMGLSVASSSLLVPSGGVAHAFSGTWYTEWTIWLPDGPSGWPYWLYYRTQCLRTVTSQFRMTGRVRTQTSYIKTMTGVPLRATFHLYEHACQTYMVVTAPRG